MRLFLESKGVKTILYPEMHSSTPLLENFLLENRLFPKKANIGFQVQKEKLIRDMYILLSSF